MAPRIFLSIGTPRNEGQRTFKQTLMSQLRAAGLEPRCIGRTPDDTDVPSLQSVVQIRELVKSCAGAVVVAFGKHMAENFREDHLQSDPVRRAQIDAKYAGQPKVCLATAWNQVEASLAYSNELPVLVLAERGIVKEGLLENDVIASVHEFDVNADFFANPQHQQMLRGWIDHVTRFQTARQAASQSDPPNALTLVQLVQGAGSLAWDKALTLAGAIIAILSGTFWLGAMFR